MQEATDPSADPGTERGAGPGSEPLLRQLTAFGIWALAINGLIGAGIFGTPGKAAALTGIYSPLISLLCGLLMLPIVLSCGEAASRFRGTGGPVLYAETAFGPFVGFQVGWAYYVTRVSASAANVSLLVATLDYFWVAADEGAVRVALLFLICGALTWVNVVGTRQAMWSVTGLTVLKFLPLLAVAIYGITVLDVDAFPFASTPVPAVKDMGAATLLLVYAYVGFETALVPAGESRNPARDMPRAVIWAMVTVTVLYVLIQAVSVAAVPDLGSAGDSRRPLVVVGEALFGPYGAVLLSFAVVVSIGGNVAAATLSAPRITYAMARDGLLPGVFSAVHAIWRTPVFSILVYGVVMFALAITGSFKELAMVSVLSRLLIYLVVVLAVPRLRNKETKGFQQTRVPAENEFRLPGGYLVPALAVLVCVGLMVQVDWDTVKWTGIFLAAGSLLYGGRIWRQG